MIKGAGVLLWRESMPLSLEVGLVHRPKYDDSQANTYYPKDEDFNDLAKEMGINLLSIDDQIDLTLDGHKQQLAI